MSSFYLGLSYDGFGMFCGGGVGGGLGVMDYVDCVDR